MHEENEYGIAAHWLYKERDKGAEHGAQDKVREALKWAEQIKNWQEKHHGTEMAPEDFLRAMKVEFFKDRTFAITPHGDVIDLPAGATPVDFAYQIHSEIGDTCIGARVNAQLAPLDYELRSGDLVEIVTQKGKRPSEDWLKFVKTSMARDHIKASLRRKQASLHNRRLPTKAELRVVVLDRVGLIKDLSTTISRSHVNIISFRAFNPHGGKFPVDKIEVGTADKDKLEKLVLKLKKIRGVREVSYQLIS
jgi:GTP pyrophosphokinase